MIRKQHINRVHQAYSLVKSYIFLNTLGKMFCLLYFCYIISYLFLNRSGGIMGNFHLLGTEFHFARRNSSVDGWVVTAIQQCECTHATELYT